MDIQEKVVGAFLVEHKEQVAGIRAVLSALDQTGPLKDSRSWAEAFRMAHSLKGGARVCALQPIEALSHQIESLFASVRDGSIEYDLRVADTIFRSLDVIEDWMAAFASGRAPPDPSRNLAEIEQIVGAAASAPRSAPLSAAPAAPSPADGPSAQWAAARPPAALELHDADTVRVATRHLDGMLRSTDALGCITSDLQRTTDTLELLAKQIQELERSAGAIRTAAAPALRQLAAMPEFTRVSRHVDSIFEQSRRIGCLCRKAVAAHHRTRSALRITGEELLRAVLQTRLISGDNILSGLGAMVRSLARDEGKEIEFRATGLGIHADRMVLQALKDPLIHLLRNAVVHGIERPQDRIAKGKERCGHVGLSLRANGPRLRILVEDDGQGVNWEHVSQIAEQRGLLNDGTDDGAATRERLSRVLFQPGFTTLTSANELAGRGMGLSVVQETVARLRGTVRIGPRADRGTTTEIAVPIFVSTERLLLVTSAGQTLALPVHAIERLLRLRASDLQRIDGRAMAILNDAPLPIIELGQALGISAHRERGEAEVLHIAVIDSSAGRFGISVDAFVAERDALIRELDHKGRVDPCICGAIMLDDSLTAFVIDPAALAERAPGEAPQQPQEAPPQKRRTGAILVVDDSFTTRTLEKCILEAQGFQVRVAVDGRQALTLLRSEPIDLVIADVQMPRMDGLTMLREIRGDPRLESLPVILVTSLDRAEDRQRGLEYGANAYIVKRRFDNQDFLATIKRFL